MTSIAEIHGGTVHKFLGDGLIVFFGDPESEAPVADAYACIAMAVAMRDQLICLADELGHYTLHIRIGIHTGHCLIGSSGSESRKDLAALGSLANLASRIESAAASDEILISEETYRLLRPWIHVVSRGKKHLKGISSAVAIYSVQALTCPANGRYLSDRIQLLN